jgi:hypothetical protein
MKLPRPKDASPPSPTPLATCTGSPRRSRLTLELTLALTFKVLVLGVLWFSFFRPDPDHPKPSRSDLFSRPNTPATQGESP